MVGCVVYIPPFWQHTHPLFRWLLSLGYGTFGAWVLWVAASWVGKFCLFPFCWTIVQQRGPLGFCSLQALAGPWWPKECLAAFVAGCLRVAAGQPAGLPPSCFPARPWAPTRS